MEWLMTVGQMSKLFNITSETLRHYDRIGLLKPIVNEENGYRYYSIKEMEILDLILDAKYLEIPLTSIKDAIANKSIENYIELIELQEKTINEKIEHLLKIKDQAREKKGILNEILNYKNLYDFDKLQIVKEENEIIYIPIEYLINGKIKQKKKELRSLYLESWMIVYKATSKGNLIENKEYIAINKKDTDNLILEKNNRIVTKTYKGKFIKIKFVGTIEEIEDYIKSIINNFYNENINKELEVIVSFIWALYNEKGTINFMEITIPLEN